MASELDESGLYHRFKARLIAWEIAPNRLLDANALAEEYGVGALPMREVLAHLEGEGMVIGLGGAGYRAPPRDAERFRDMYSATRILLECAMDQRRGGPPPTPVTAGAITGILNRIEHMHPIDPELLVFGTGELFALVTGRSDGDELGAVRWIARYNDQLYQLRLFECQVYSDIPQELMRMGELFLAENYEALRTAVGDYHQRRIASLPSVLALGRP